MKHVPIEVMSFSRELETEIVVSVGIADSFQSADNLFKAGAPIVLCIKFDVSKKNEKSVFPSNCGIVKYCISSKRALEFYKGEQCV